MTIDAWVTDFVLVVILVATGFGLLACFPRELLMAWWMRACGWEWDAADRTCADVGKVVAAKRTAPTEEESGQRIRSNGEGT